MEGGWLVHPVRSYALDALYPTGQRRDGLWDGLLAVEARPPPLAPRPPPPAPRPTGLADESSGPVSYKL